MKCSLAPVTQAPCLQQQRVPLLYKSPWVCPYDDVFFTPNFLQPHRSGSANELLGASTAAHVSSTQQLGMKGFVLSRWGAMPLAYSSSGPWFIGGCACSTCCMTCMGSNCDLCCAYFCFLCVLSAQWCRVQWVILDPPRCCLTHRYCSCPFIVAVTIVKSLCTLTIDVTDLTGGCISWTYHNTKISQFRKYSQIRVNFARPINIVLIDLAS